MRSFILNAISQEDSAYPITFFTASNYHLQETIPTRAIAFHQILLILEGTGTVYCNGKSHKLQRGCAFFTAQGTAVEYINEGNLVSAFLTVKGAAVDQLAEKFSDNGFLYLENTEVEKYLSWITRLIDDYQSGCEQGSLSVQAYSFFVDFLSQRPSDVPAWLRKVVQFIHLHFDEKLTLTMLANHAYVSTSKLCHGFKKQYSVSVFEYIMNVRLQYAHDLLHTSPDLMTKDVAAQCGFRDCGYFCKAYRNKYGRTPSEEK